MKFAKLVLALTLAPWTVAFAGSPIAPEFELYAKTDNTECTVIGTTMTKKTTLLDGAAGYIVTKEIQTFGFEPIVRRAAAKSRGIMSRYGYLFLAKLNGVNYGLNTGDSYDSTLLVTFLSQACAD